MSVTTKFIPSVTPEMTLPLLTQEQKEHYGHDKAWTYQDFAKHFNETVEITPFSTDWKNRTGYLDHATKVALAPGKVTKSVDDFGRAIILIGTHVGTICVFVRNTDDARVVMNVPHGIRELFQIDNIVDSQVMSLLFNHAGNIGTRLAEFKTA